MKVRVSILFWALAFAACSPAPPNALDSFVRFQKQTLNQEFFGEGVAAGDINGNGIPDLVAGPYWYEGPEFTQRHEYYPPHEFDRLQYSDNFFVFLDDFDADGLTDILVVGFPGQEARWYRNPGGPGHWERYLAFEGVDNESPAFADVTGDGRPELVFHTQGFVGYAAPDAANPTAIWKFQPISTLGKRHRFTHGFGVGDLTGSGWNDVLEHDGWWENPGPESEMEVWKHHPFDFAQGGAQMLVFDVDGDGLNDVVTSHYAHGWGLSWFRQRRDPQGPRFERHVILPDSPEPGPNGVQFSQLHALEAADIDGDGLPDVVTGKRFWAHGPEGDPEPNAPAVLYWFQLTRNPDGVEFRPHLIDDDSGVGTQIAAVDVTGNGRPDVLVCNKKGTFVFRNQ